MDTLARMDFVAQLVTAGLLSPADGMDVLRRAAAAGPESFTAELRAHGLVVEEH